MSWNKSTAYDSVHAASFKCKHEAEQSPDASDYYGMLHEEQQWHMLQLSLFNLGPFWPNHNSSPVQLYKTNDRKYLS